MGRRCWLRVAEGPRSGIGPRGDGSLRATRRWPALTHHHSVGLSCDSPPSGILGGLRTRCKSLAGQGQAEQCLHRSVGSWLPIVAQ